MPAVLLSASQEKAFFFFFVFLLSKLRLKFNLSVFWSCNTLGMNLIKQPVQIVDLLHLNELCYVSTE